MKDKGAKKQMPCEDQSGENELEVGMTVIVVGTVTSVSQQGNHCVVAIDVTQFGDTVGLEFYSEELVKGSTGLTISGALEGPTGPE